MLHVNPDTVVALTRKEKLLRWADLIRQYPSYLDLYNNLEYWNLAQRRHTLVDRHYAYPTAISVAASDPVFQSLGIGDNVQSVMDFFELSLDELHAFSCDCGGTIGNSMQAARIEAIAHGKWL